ncbi:hypothetical protein [Fictibacillus phosphorivorans]|nr:hypothetical protein [Fictibacillus phosphorivorans]
MDWVWGIWQTAFVDYCRLADKRHSFAGLLPKLAELNRKFPELMLEF